MHQGQVLVLLPAASQKTKLYNCHADAEGLGWSHVSSLAVDPEYMSSHKFRSVVSVGFPIMILTPFPCSYDPSSLFSWRPGAWPSA